MFDDHLAGSLPANWPISLNLDVEDVWNGFYLHALLIDAQEHGQVFVLPNKAPSQAERLRGALQERNMRMAGTGQEAWNHACDLCCWIETDKDGNATGM